MQKRKRGREFTIGLLSFGLLAGVAMTASPAQADQESHDSSHRGDISKSIVSGNKWLVTTNPGPACPAPNCQQWTNIHYDDSNWVQPVLSDNNGATTLNDVLPRTKAKFMWSPSAVNVAYFRYKFTLNSTRKTLPVLAEAFVEADDYFELWVNGNFVTSGLLTEHSTGTKWDPQIADMTPYLQDGENVIAIRANDGDCKARNPGTGLCLHIPDNGDPFSRVNRNVFFDGVIETVGSHDSHD